MFEETTDQSVRHNEHGSGCGCGSHPQTPAVADEKAASDQAARDEVVRARNKRGSSSQQHAGSRQRPSLFGSFGIALICYAVYGTEHRTEMDCGDCRRSRERRGDGWIGGDRGGAVQHWHP